MQREMTGSITGGESGTPEIFEDVTDRLLLELRTIWSRSAVSTLIAVGEAIVRHCYGGDIEAWRNRGPSVQLRHLESHPRLPFARKTVYLGLHFYDLSLRLTHQPFLNDLGVGHVRAVLGLKPDDQERLLSAAHTDHWTIAQLAERVAETRRAAGRKSGRPPTPPDVRTIKQLRLHVDAVENLLTEVIEVATCAPGERVARLLETVAEVKSEINSWGLPLPHGTR